VLIRQGLRFLRLGLPGILATQTDVLSPRMLRVIEDLAVPDTSISGRRVARELTAIVDQRGKPGLIVSDNATELTRNAMLAWCVIRPANLEADEGSNLRTMT